MVFPLTITSLTFYYFFKEQGQYDLVGVYTLVSSLLLSLICLSYYFYTLYLYRKHGDCTFKRDCFTGSLCALYVSWEIVTLVVLFTSADVFPAASSYGGFTIFFMIIYSLPSVVFFILSLNHFCLNSMYSIYSATFYIFSLSLTTGLWCIPSDILA